MEKTRRQLLQKHISEILKAVGEDPGREGLLETPRRYARAMEFFTSGYEIDCKKVVGNALYHAESSDLVVLKDIELFSLCEHHLVPFYGKAHVGYIPKKAIVGLSKIPRMVDVFARRLQVQERLTHQIATALMDILNPHGVAVVIEAIHLCMMMRGVQKQHGKTTTSSMLGVFRESHQTRQEFLNLLAHNGHKNF
jgi:GTP cyclohydrolase I